MWQKEFLEVVIGDATSLREAVHAFANFHIYVTIVDEVMEVVVLHDCFGDGRHRDAHVCIVFGSVRAALVCPDKSP